MSQVLLEEARNRTALSERQAGAGVESSRQVFIVNFNDEAYLNQSFTSDIKKWEEALDRMETEGGTAMRDALSMSMDYLKEKAKKDKKVLIAITDGNDTTSINISLEDLMRKAQQSDALIYSIGIVSEEEPRAVKKGCGLRRHGLLPQGSRRCGQDRARGGKRDPPPIYAGIFTPEPGARWNFPQNYRHSECTGTS